MEIAPRLLLLLRPAALEAAAQAEVMASEPRAPLLGRSEERQSLRATPALFIESSRPDRVTRISAAIRHRPIVLVLGMHRSGTSLCAHILSARGVNLAKEALSSEKKLAEVLELPFDEIVQIELRVIVEQIRSLNKSIAELGKTIGDEGSKLEGHKGLSTIKGIGKITGAILLSVIGDVNDFADEGRLASYFGIVPRVSNSNETERSGRIHKRGTKLGRTALVQSALIAANYSPYLKRFYEQVKARRGAGKAIIALARKFLGIIYRTLKNKWVFEDFPNFVLAEES